MSFQVQRMSHAVFLRLQITQVILVGSDFDGNIFDDFQSVSLKTDTFHGVICHQAHLLNTQQTQNLGTTAVVALVGLETQVDVGIDGVETFLLQLVGGYLVHQADTATLLLHVDHHALAFFLNGLHGLMQLLAAVATLRAEYIACHTR